MLKLIEQQCRRVLLIVVCVLPCQLTYADLLRVNVGLSSGRFLDAINVTDDKPIAFIDADWSFDNGAFFGGDCYQGSSERGASLKRGCNAYLGYFSEISDTQAVSFELRHKRYLVNTGFFWTDNEVSLNWHVNKNVTLSTTLNDNWLDHGNATISIKGDYFKPLNERLAAYVSVGVMKFESSANVSTIEHLEAGLKYQKKRWGVDLSAVFVDEAIVDFIDFDTSQNQLKLTFRYQIY